jgi:phosphoserine aminotransferase
MDRVYNFSAGPAMLPLPVLERARAELPTSSAGWGRSVLEISHRSPEFRAILERTTANLRRLLAIPDGYDVLYLHGGGRLQFSMVPINLLRGTGLAADYLVTGAWGQKAFEEAGREGAARLAWSGKTGGYRRVPEPGELDLDPRAAYLHLTSNETIEGVQFRELPPAGDVPLVCDASSDFLSRPIDISRFGLLYAGAQKNAGIAGLGIVIVRRDLLERIPSGLPSMLDYRVHAAEGSLHNTPPVSAIWFTMLVTDWLLDELGDLAAVDRFNRRKAELLYATLDESDGFYRPHAERGSRSLMNVTWRLPDAELERRFLAEAAARGLVDLKGHRSVGGIRASIYNAMPLAGVAALCAFMEEFRAGAPAAAGAAAGTAS